MGLLVIALVLVMHITMAVFFFSPAATTSSMSLESLRMTGLLCCLLLWPGHSIIMINGGITACRGESVTWSGYYRSSILLFHALQVAGGGTIELLNSSSATRLLDEEDEAEKAKLDAMIEQLLQSVAVEEEKQGAHAQNDQEISTQGKSEKPPSSISSLLDETCVQKETSIKIKAGKKSSKKQMQQGQPQDSLSAHSTKIATPHTHSAGQSYQRSTSVRKSVDIQHIELQKDNKTATIQIIPPPPNAFYRFLLRNGYVGHVILITLIVGHDWMERFVPPIYTVSRLILLRLHIVADPKSTRPTTRYTTSTLDGGLTGVTNEEYTGIVSSNRGYGSKKMKNEKKKRDDEVAFQKLVKVGSSNIAKYKHLSIDFMTRHRLGEFSNIERNQIPKLSIDEPNQYKTASNREAKITSNLFQEAEDDSDTGDWIVDALTTDTVHTPSSREEDNYYAPNFLNEKSDQLHSQIKSNNNIADKVSSMSKTSSLFGANSKDAAASIALSTRRIPLSSDAVRRAAVAAGQRAAQSTNQKQKQNQLRRQTVSDRDGGSGVLGRLRAATSENFLSRHIMGAYPGDALPIEEAGNANGLFDLARKYGYKEWITASKDEVERKVRGNRKKGSLQKKKYSSTNNFDV